MTSHMIRGGDQMRPRLSMKMQMRASPQLVLAGELLRVSGADLERRIRQELEENPALEKIKPKSLRKVSQDKLIRPNTDINLMSKSDWTDYGHELSTFEDRLEKMALRAPVLSQLAAQVALLVAS